MPHPAFLPVAPLPTRPSFPSHLITRRPPHASLTPPDPITPRALAAGALAILAASIVPLPAFARQKESVITMTDQVPNFTLPSQKAAYGNDGAPTLLVRVANVAKKVVPVLSVVALAVWSISKLLRRAEERQLRDFKTQLQSFSSMLELDAPAPPTTETDSAKMAKQIMDGTSRRYKFRTEDAPKQADDISSKVRLDLFRAGGNSGSASPVKQAPEDAAAPNVTIPDAQPESEYETAIADCLRKVEVDGEPAKNDAISSLNAAREDAGLNENDAQKQFESFLSRIVSVQIDRAAVNLDSDDSESLKNLHQLATTMSAARTLGPKAQLTYGGAHAGHAKIQEELYRRYAVFCLSSEERVADDLQSLVEMQTLLAVTDARAETINTEIAKGMFQVAVSAAMADGSLNPGSKEALDELKNSFGDFLDGGSADSIMSEVAVMRAMYSLQQLLQEQGVSDDDVQELRKMCRELGVDVDEMLQNANALGDALGPEAKDFVESLRKLLNDSPPAGDSTMVTTTAKPVDPLADSSQPNEAAS